MRAIVTVDVDINNARKSLEVAGYYDVRGKTDEEVCKIAIKMNDCYAVNTQEIKICENAESENK